MTVVFLEVGKRRTFATALDWPGWSRSGRDQERALEALVVYRDRYSAVVSSIGLDIPDGPMDVVESMAGDATTDFGAPSRQAKADQAPLTGGELDNRIAILEACWTAFDEIAETAPEELRRGPRGGGRMTSVIVEHVVEAERAYARKIGFRPSTLDPADPVAVTAMRAGMVGAVQEAAPLGPADREGTRLWPVRYFLRRTAWHALDHAWEIEDRTD